MVTEKQLRDALKVVEKYSKQSEYREPKEWISVKDRLPEADVTVIGLVSGWKVQLVELCEGDDGRYHWEDSYVYNDRPHVLGWIPMPSYDNILNK